MVLKEKVREAFEKLGTGDLRGFVTGISDVSDVRWGWHKEIVDNEIDKELKRIETGEGFFNGM